LTIEYSIKANRCSFSSEQSDFGQATSMIFKPESFQKPVKGEASMTIGFITSWTELHD